MEVARATIAREEEPVLELVLLEHFSTPTVLAPLLDPPPPLFSFLSLGFPQSTEPAARLLAELGRVALLDDGASVQHHNPLAEANYQAKLVRDHDDGVVGKLVPDDILHLPLRLLVCGEIDLV